MRRSGPLPCLLIAGTLLGCYGKARGVAGDHDPQRAAAPAPRSERGFGLTLGGPLLPPVPPGSVTSTEEAEAASRTLDYLAASDPARAPLRQEILRFYLARANETLDRDLFDDAFESFSAALRLFDARELANPATPPPAPGLLALAQRIDGAFRRRGAHEQVVAALCVQLTLAPTDPAPRTRLIELGRWLSGSLADESAGPGAAPAPPPASRSAPKEVSHHRSGKSGKSPPAAAPAAPPPATILAAVHEPAPALLRDLEQAFRLWPAALLVDELSALYQREARLPSLGGLDLSQLRGPRDMINFTLRQRSPLNAPGFKLSRLYLRVGRPEDATQIVNNLPRSNQQEKLLGNLLSTAFHPGAAPLDTVRLAITLAQNPDDQEAALRTCQDLTLREPALLEAYQCTADLALQVGRKGLALRTAEQARAQKPGERNLWDRVLRLYEDRLSDLTSDETPRDLSGALGFIESYMDRMRQAFPDPSQAQDLNFQLALTLAEVGRGDYNHGRLAQAVQSLTRSVSVEPSAAALEQLGLIQLKRGQPAEAMTSLERARALQLNDKRVEPLLKQFYKARVGRLIAESLDAQALSGNGAELRAQALELRQRSVKDWEAVLAVEQLMPERRAEAELERGKLLYQEGERDEAITAFQQAIDAVPEDDEHSHDSGQVYADAIAFLVQQGELNEALSAYRRALGRARVVEYLKVYCSLWINDLSLRSGQQEDPLATAYLKSVQGGKWYAELARWAVSKHGPGDEALLRARADTVGKKAEADFYVGLARLRAGEKPQADELFRKVLASDMMAFFEYEMAGNYLRRGAPTAPLLMSPGDHDRKKAPERHPAKGKRPAGSI